MAEFHVYIEKDNVPEDGWMWIDIDNRDVADECGGNCDMYGDQDYEIAEKAIKAFLEHLDTYYFANNLDRDEIYKDIVRMAETQSQ